MTEEDALERVHEIGTAFANDYNDGDGPDLESATITSDGFGRHTLTYWGETDGEEWTFVWTLELISGPPG